MSRELDNRCRLVVKKMPNGLLSDFGKVCRIKSIPEFYANYFLGFVWRREEGELSKIVS